MMNFEEKIKRLKMIQEELREDMRKNHREKLMLKMLREYLEGEV